MSQQGAPDWQESNQWQSIFQVAANFVCPAVGSVVILPVTACAEWQSLQGTIFSANNPASILVQWFYDKAGLILAGERQFDLMGLSVRQEFCFPHAGPFVKVTALGNGTLVANITSNLGFTNRSGPTFYGQSQGILTSGFAVTVPAGATNHFPCSFVWPGRAHFWTNNGANVNELWVTAIEAVDRVGNVTTVDEVRNIDVFSVAANLRFDVVLPAMQCQVTIVNGGAADHQWDWCLVADVFH